MDTNPVNLIQKLQPLSWVKILGIVVAVSLLAGLGTGYFLNATGTNKIGPVEQPPKTAHQDTKTFRDFAEGKIQKKPTPKDPGEYTEGTHVLVREGAVPVALTSSVVDLANYEGKRVKVFGETQKAIKEGWLMDVGKVEEL